MDVVHWTVMRFVLCVRVETLEVMSDFTRVSARTLTHSRGGVRTELRAGVRRPRSPQAGGQSPG